MSIGFPGLRFIAIVMMAAILPAGAAAWVSYQDAAGCHVSYRSDLFRAETMVSGEPRKFSGPDDQTYFRLIGLDNNEGLSPPAIKGRYFGESNSLARSPMKAPNLVFWFSRVIAAKAFSICGWKRHSISKASVFFEIVYPKSNKVDFDPMITRMSHSFAVE